MLKAIAVTFLIFAILFAGIISLKRSANLWRIPKGVKAQPYDDDESEDSNKEKEEGSKKNNQAETPQLEDQSDSKQKTDSQEKH